MSLDAAARRPPSGTYLRPPRVLVIDDEPMLRRALHRILAESFEVVTAEGGDEALGMLRDGARFDAILCDLTMPGMSGLQVLEAVERDFPQQGPRMVFMSGGDPRGHVRAGIEARHRTCLDKPFEPDALLACLEERARAHDAAPAVRPLAANDR